MEPIIKEYLKACKILYIDENEKIKPFEEKDGFTVILAYILYIDNQLIYLYTKKTQRHKGYAKKLLECANFQDALKVKFLTYKFVKFCKKNNYKILYNPFYFPYEH